MQVVARPHRQLVMVGSRRNSRPNHFLHSQPLALRRRARLLRQTAEAAAAYQAMPNSQSTDHRAASRIAAHPLDAAQGARSPEIRPAPAWDGQTARCPTPRQPNTSSVSYTHLDVYKRQHPCRGRPRRAGSQQRVRHWRYCLEQRLAWTASTRTRCRCEAGRYLRGGSDTQESRRPDASSGL